MSHILLDTPKTENSDLNFNKKYFSKFLFNITIVVPCQPMSR